jgi:hypothetical protein
MSSNPNKLFITEADVAKHVEEHFGWKKKDKTDNVPTIRFDIPPLTTEAIVKSVQQDKAIWKSLQQTAVEDEATKRAKAMSDRYDMTPIPKPEWDPEDWHL